MLAHFMHIWCINNACIYEFKTIFEICWSAADDEKKWNESNEKKKIGNMCNWQAMCKRGIINIS